MAVRMVPVLVVVFIGLLRPLDAQVSPEWSLFDNFMTKFGRQYRDEDAIVLERFRIFQESLRRQYALNALEAERGGTADYGVNKFSDLSSYEFKKLYLSGLRPSPANAMSSDPDNLLSLKEDLPPVFNWQDEGVINSVRNQKKCGSCWAFAVVETIESKYAIQYGPLYQLSPQQLISCETKQGQLDGCAGGILSVAFSVLQQNQTTIVMDSSYKFESGDGKTHSCKSPLPNVGVQLRSYHFNESLLNETEMKLLLYSHSPLTTSVNAVGWQDYAGGIIQHHCTGGHQYIDHAVQVVGFNMNGPVPYWIVRNTWGTDWGEDGYVRLKYGSNMCGVAQEVAAVLNVTGVNLNSVV